MRDNDRCWAFSHTTKKNLKKKRPEDSKLDESLYISDASSLRRKKNEDASPNDSSVASLLLASLLLVSLGQRMSLTNKKE